MNAIQLKSMLSLLMDNYRTTSFTFSDDSLEFSVYLDITIPQDVINSIIYACAEEGYYITFEKLSTSYLVYARMPALTHVYSDETMQFNDPEYRKTKQRFWVIQSDKVIGKLTMRHTTYALTQTGAMKIISTLDHTNITLLRYDRNTQIWYSERI